MALWASWLLAFYGWAALAAGLPKLWVWDALKHGQALCSLNLQPDVMLNCNGQVEQVNTSAPPGYIPWMLITGQGKSLQQKYCREKILSFYGGIQLPPNQSVPYESLPPNSGMELMNEVSRISGEAKWINLEPTAAGAVVHPECSMVTFRTKMCPSWAVDLTATGECFFPIPVMVTLYTGTSFPVQGMITSYIGFHKICTQGQAIIGGEGSCWYGSFNNVYMKSRPLLALYYNKLLISYNDGKFYYKGLLITADPNEMEEFLRQKRDVIFGPETGLIDLTNASTMATPWEDLHTPWPTDNSEPDWERNNWWKNQPPYVLVWIGCVLALLSWATFALYASVACCACSCIKLKLPDF